MKHADLEEMEITFLPEEGTLHDAEDGEHLASLGPRRRAGGMGPLFAAAPRLALACLSVRETIRECAEGTAGTDEGERFATELSELDAALELAGVEIPR